MQSLRLDRKAVLDIEIGLGSPFPLKGEMLSSNCVRDFPELIIIDDDDNNDGQRYSSRSSTEVSHLSSSPSIKLPNLMVPSNFHLMSLLYCISCSH